MDVLAIRYQARSRYTRQISSPVNARKYSANVSGDAPRPARARGIIYNLERRFTGGGEQFCPRLVGRFDKSGHFECRAGLKRLDGRDGI